MSNQWFHLGAVGIRESKEVAAAALFEAGIRDVRLSPLPTPTTDYDLPRYRVEVSINYAADERSDKFADILRNRHVFVHACDEPADLEAIARRGGLCT